MKLSIIIPAYNEEKAIGATIERSLQARQAIVKDAGVESVEVIVVNDGSKDDTRKIVERYKEVGLVSYENNKGYGAAIKQGFDKAGGDLLSFLDADGTCDPKLFIGLINSLVKNNADIAIGSRLGAGTKMPTIRKIGNIIYTKIINFFAGTHITDSSSGMRVLKRPALEKLYPLPDGLNFTPAMTCKALMGGQLKLVEVPIAYADRVGKSKLSVIKDGLRFLKTILGAVLFYRPIKFFATLLFAAWVIIWVIFTAREIFIKNNFHDYRALMQKQTEGRRAYVWSEKFYEFLVFCNDRLPPGSNYMWTKGGKEDLERRRATYYLYPHLEDENAEFILVYDDPAMTGGDYRVFAKLDDARYILKRKRGLSFGNN